MPPAERPDIVFFDAGGVLVHFPPAVARVAAALRSLGQEPPAAAVEAAVARARAVRDAEGPLDLLWPPAAEDARILLAAAALAEALGLPARRAAYLRDTCYHIRNLSLYPDTAAALQAVRDAGVRVGLISNAPASLPAALHHLGLAAQFQPLVVSAEVGTAKPDRRIYAEALRRAGVAEPGRAVFIDDLPENVVGAEAAGLRALRLDRAAGDTLQGLLARILP